MMGEPGVLPRELALPQLPLPARCNTSCYLRCPDPECAASQPTGQPKAGRRLSIPAVGASSSISHGAAKSQLTNNSSAHSPVHSPAP